VRPSSPLLSFDDVVTRLDLTAGAKTSTFDVMEGRRPESSPHPGSPRRNWAADEVSSYVVEPTRSVLVQEARD
jgi:hypothetical protein